MCHHGPIRHSTLWSGVNFKSAVLWQTLDAFGIMKFHTTACHPQGDGLVERLNRSFLELLCSATQIWNQIGNGNYCLLCMLTGQQLIYPLEYHRMYWCLAKNFIQSYCIWITTYFWTYFMYQHCLYVKRSELLDLVKSNYWYLEINSYYGKRPQLSSFTINECLHSFIIRKCRLDITLLEEYVITLIASNYSIM